MHNVSDIARYVIYKYNENGWEITNQKLQRVLYYIQGYSYKLLERPAFRADIERWVCGPSVPSVYFAYDDWGSEPINPGYSNELACAVLRIRCDEQLKMVIDAVCRAAKKRTTEQLTEMSKSEKPYLLDDLRALIAKHTIQRYFEYKNPLTLTYKYETESGEESGNDRKLQFIYSRGK